VLEVVNSSMHIQSNIGCFDVNNGVEFGGVHAYSVVHFFIETPTFVSMDIWPSNIAQWRFKLLIQFWVYKHVYYDSFDNDTRRDWLAIVLIGMEI
jgi:hypothetical protein